MRTTLSVAPTVEPITADEVKTHLRIMTSDDDGYINDLIKVVRQKVEYDLRRALITQTWKMYLDDFPASGNLIRIPYPPLQSAGMVIKYYDTANVQQTWSSDEYEVDIYSEPARVGLVSGCVYPSTYDRMNAVEITFVAGYGLTAATVPWTVKQAMFLLCGHYYENREATTDGRPITSVPMAYENLIWTERAW